MKLTTSRYILISLFIVILITSTYFIANYLLNKTKKNDNHVSNEIETSKPIKSKSNRTEARNKKKKTKPCKDAIVSRVYQMSDMSETVNPSPLEESIKSEEKRSSEADNAFFNSSSSINGTKLHENQKPGKYLGPYPDKLEESNSEYEKNSSIQTDLFESKQKDVATQIEELKPLHQLTKNDTYLLLDCWHGLTTPEAERIKNMYESYTQETILSTKPIWYLEYCGYHIYNKLFRGSIIDYSNFMTFLGTIFYNEIFEDDGTVKYKFVGENETMKNLFINLKNASTKTYNQFCNYNSFELAGQVLFVFAMKSCFGIVGFLSWFCGYGAIRTYLNFQNFSH